MSVACSPAVRRNTLVSVWGLFFLQVFIAISFELGDDLGRGLFSQHGTLEGVRNAQKVVAFEAARGFWVEPAWQLFFLHTRHVLAWTVTALDVAHVMNLIYVGGHVFFTLGVAVWAYVYRPRHFVVLRNIIMLVNVFALAVYENFPVAPPRLTSGLIFDHHHFVFQDTVFGAVTASGRMVSTSLAYNEFSAMPSVHMAWALVAGSALVVLGGRLWVRVLGVVYPCLMLLAVVVTGNHYLLDAAAAVPVVAAAAAVSVGLARLGARRQWPFWVRQVVVGQG